MIGHVIAQCISCKREADCIQARFDSGSAIGGPQWWCMACLDRFEEYLKPVANNS